MEDNVHLAFMHQTLTNMQKRNTPTGYLLMAKSALSPFKPMPEVEATLKTLVEIYQQPERPSVENLRQQLLALRAANLNTMYVQLAQPAEVIYVDRGTNPSFKPTQAPTPDLMRMIDFALAELEKGWPQPVPVAATHKERSDKSSRKICDCSLDSVARTIKSFIWTSPQPQAEGNNNHNDNNARTSPSLGKSKAE